MTNDPYIGKIVELKQFENFILDNVDEFFDQQPSGISWYNEGSLFFVLTIKPKTIYSMNWTRMDKHFYILKPLEYNSRNPNKLPVWCKSFVVSETSNNQYFFKIIDEDN